MPLDVTGSSFNLKAVDRGPESMVLNVFGGRVSYTIFAGQGGSRLMSQGFTLDALCMFKRDLKAVRDGQPGTTRTLVFQKWVPEEKKYKTDSSLIIGKDDKNVYYFETQFNSNGTHKSIRFNLRAAGTTTSTTDEPSPAISSAIRLEAIIAWLDDQVPFLIAATTRPFGGNRNSNNNNNSGGGGSNSSNDYSGADASF